MRSTLVPPGQVTAEEPHLQGATPLDLREGEVATGGHGPGNVDDPTDLPKEPQRLGPGLLKTGTQGQCLQGHHAHSLAVDRVEGAYRVPHHQQAVGKPGEPFIVVPHAGGIPEPDGLVERLRTAQCIVDVGELQGRGEVCEARRLRRRVVAQDAEQRDDASVVLHRRERSAARVVGGCRVDDPQVAAEQVRGEPVGAAGVPDPDPDLLHRRTRVSEHLQPRRRTRTTAGCVHDQVGGQDLLGAAVESSHHPSADDAARRPTWR